MADKSENYKLWYSIWLAKQVNQFIADSANAGIPLTVEDAKKLLQNDPEHEQKWMASDIYQKYVARLSSKIPKNFTTADRVSTSAVKKRSAQIMKEDPGLSEEEATAQADKDIQKRQEKDDKDVADSKDPVAAKILTNISSILMDISEDVLAIRESGPNGLDAAEAAREKDKDGKGKLTKEDEAQSYIERLAQLVTVFLIPMFLGFMSKFVDLTSLSGMLITAFVGLIAYLGSTKLLTALFTVIRGIFLSLSGSIDKMLGGVFNKIGTIFGRQGSAAPPVPTPNAPAPTPTPTPGTNAPAPGPAPGPATGPAGRAAKPVSALTTLGKGIKDLGAGIGKAIQSFLTGFAKGLAAFANPKTIGGIAVIIGATAALGGLALLFKAGGLEPKDFIAVGLGLTALAAGIMVMGSGPVIAAANALGAAMIPMAKAAGVIALLGAALIPGAYAFSLFGEALKLAGEGTEKMVENLFRLTEIDAGKLAQLGPAMMAVGLGFLAFQAAMAVGTFASIGQSILGFFGADSPLEQLLEFAEDAEDANFIKVAKSVDIFVKSLGKLAALKFGNLTEAGDGLQALSAGLGTFAIANVASGLGNLVTGFLSKITGQKTPIEQIQDLAEDSKAIYDAGNGVEALGKGLSSFNSLDPDKLEETLELIATLDDEQLEKLAKLASVAPAAATPVPRGGAPAPSGTTPAPTGTSPGAPPAAQPTPTQQVNPVPTQPMQTEKLNGATRESKQTESKQAAPAQNTVVQQNAVNNSNVNYNSTKMGSAVQGDALAAT